MNNVSGVNSDLFRRAHYERTLEIIAPRKWIVFLGEVFALLGDAGSGLGNGLSALAQLSGRVSHAAAAPGTSTIVISVARGIFGCVSAANMLLKCAYGLYTAYQRSNGQAAVKCALDTVVGAAFGVLYASMFLENFKYVMMYLPHATLATITTVGLYVLYPALAVSSGYGWIINIMFRDQLDQLVEDDTKLDQLCAGLQWINEQIDATGASKEADLKRKWDRFAFCSSEACCYYARKHVPGVLQRLRKGTASAADIKMAQKIIQEVKLANDKQQMCYAILMTIAVLGVVAVATLPTPAGLIFFAIASFCLWPMIDSSDIQRWVGNRVCGSSRIAMPTAEHIQSRLDDLMREAAENSQRLRAMLDKRSKSGDRIVAGFEDRLESRKLLDVFDNTRTDSESD